MHKPLFVSLILSCVLLYQTPVEARIYEYVDERGKKVFVDRLSKVPAKYRDQLQSRKEQAELLAPEDLKALKKERDLKQLKLKLTHQRRELQDEMRRFITPVDLKYNRITVPVKVVYGARIANLNLVLDTGASSTVIHANAIQSLGAQLNSGGYARVADGRTVEIKQTTFSRVEIGPYTYDNVRSAVIDYQNASIGNHGLLGMDFLLGADYELDRNNRQIIWDPSLYKRLQEKLLALDELEQRLNNPVATPTQ